LLQLGLELHYVLRRARHPEECIHLARLGKYYQMLTSLLDSQFTVIDSMNNATIAAKCAQPGLIQTLIGDYMNYENSNIAYAGFDGYSTVESFSRVVFKVGNIWFLIHVT